MTATGRGGLLRTDLARLPQGSPGALTCSRAVLLLPATTGRPATLCAWPCMLLSTLCLASGPECSGVLQELANKFIVKIGSAKRTTNNTVEPLGLG